MGPNSMEKVLAGKSYAKGVRAHKLTVQALWQLLIPQLMPYLQEHDQELEDDIENAVRSNDPQDYSALVVILASAKFHTHMTAFAQDRDPNFQFWWQYMDMVCILLRFIRAQRDGLWELHIVTFRQMLPYLHRYDHTNYARWGCVYLAEMQKLPDEVKDEFVKGNFVVKGSDQRFNQVSPDHSQEWLNGTGKKGGGIVGITKTTSALNRWALSYNLRACIANKTRALFHVGEHFGVLHYLNGCIYLVIPQLQDTKMELCSDWTIAFTLTLPIFTEINLSLRYSYCPPLLPTFLLHVNLHP